MFILSGSSISRFKLFNSKPRLLLKMTSMQTLKNDNRIRPRTRLSYTATTKERNKPHLEFVLERVSNKINPIETIDVLQIGPGVVHKNLEKVIRLRKKRGVSVEVLKRFESVVRKLPLSEKHYNNFETGEIFELAERFHQKINLTVMDISSRVLEITNFLYHANDPDLILRDISKPVITYRNKYDVVLCMNVLVHVRNPFMLEHAEKNIKAQVKNGGYLISNTPTNHFDDSDRFHKLKNYVYQKYYQD